jgi:hypothetical protein
LISHLEETQLISAQGSTNLDQQRTESKRMPGLIITLMTEFILKRQICLYVSAFAIALGTPTFHGNWKLTPFYFVAVCSFANATIHQFFF